MKVLVVAYAYPPFPIVGAIRPAKLVKRLHQAGHEVHVLTAKLPGEVGRFRETGDRLKVEVVPTWPNPKNFYRWMKRKWTNVSFPDGNGGTAAVSGVERWAAPEQIPFLKRLILSAIQTPDDLQGFIGPAVIRGLQAFPKGPDMVFSTSPPPSSHLAGLLVKAVSGATWAAEFRDPWINNEAAEAEGRVRSRPTDAVNAWLERSCIRFADKLVTVTEMGSEVIGGRHGGEAIRKIILARSGIDSLEAPLSVKPDGPLRILYLGGIGGGRDPRPFLNGVSALIKARNLGNNDLIVEFVGNCQVFHDIDITEVVAGLGISSYVRFRGWVDHDEAKEVLKTPDLLLLLAQRQRAQVPNKLYEYLGVGRPILAFVDDDGESADLLRRGGGQFLVTGKDGWDALPLLLKAYDSYRDGTRFNGARPDPAVLSRWTTEFQYGHLLQALGLA